MRHSEESPTVTVSAWKKIGYALDVVPGALACLLCAHAGAQTLPQEYPNLIRSQNNVGSLDASLLGERIDYYDGHVDFVATDVSVPGNNALPVAIGRRYSVAANPSGVIPERGFGDWDIELPHLEGIVADSVGWTVPGTLPNARCSRFAAAPAAVVSTPSKANKGQTVTTVIDWEQYSTGYSLAVPGYARSELLQRSPDNPEQPTSGTYPIVTNDWWMISCLSQLDPASPGTGEGFMALAPDGTKYTFNWLAMRPYVPLSRPADTAEPDVVATLDRSDAWMMATKVEDRFGNWVKYEYDPYEPLQLRGITSSDGRAITVHYTGTTNIVHDVTDGSHTWNYAYAWNGAYYTLTTVTLPDASKWQIDFDTLNDISWTYPDPWTCGSPGTPSTPYTYAGMITHPSGAQGRFTFSITRHGRYSVPTGCYENSAGVEFASIQPSLFDSLSLTEKRITGPNLSTLTWALAYAGCSASSCNSTVTTTVTDPRNYKTRYTFGTGYNNDEGLVLKKESGGSGSSYLQTDTFTYFPATGQSYPDEIGTPTQTRGDATRLAQLRPMKQRVTTLQGTNFTYTASSLDEFGFPRSIARSGTASKTDTVTYNNNKTKWVLGTVQKVVSGSTELELVLNSLNQPTSASRFGEVDHTFGYNTDGTMQWSRDGDGVAHAITYSNWYRGVPRNVSAAGEGSSVTVSNSGTIDSWTDERGSVTSYDHDAMGRLTGIHYPSGDPGTGGTQTFNATTIDWSTGATGWVSTETTGSYQKITKYDALLRPVLSNENNTRYINMDYDGDIGPSFVSNPGSIPNEGEGTTYDHDALGRVITRNYVGYVTHYVYQNGFAMRVDDPNASTTYNYLAYDTPTTAWPTSIDGGLYTTTISRDTWGRPKSVTRGGTGGVTRKWGWSGRFVCSTYSPERGTTVLQRDSAGNVTASADVSSDDVGCLYSAINSSNKVARTYDGRNRLLTVDYPGGTDLDIVQTWWPTGRIKTADRGGINRMYNYNRRGLLTFETLDIDSDSYEVDYAYNTRGQLSTVTYPDSFSVDYAPNAWGEPTQVGTFATNVTYWPNGAVKGFTYGNGIAHSVTLNSQLLPDHITDAGTLDLSYSVYDGLGNPLTIVDNRAGHYESKTMTYDAANRLWTANAPNLWGNATYTYDNYDNLKTTTVGGVLTTYTIDGATNRATSYQLAGSSHPMSYDSHGNLLGTDAALFFEFNVADLMWREGGSIVLTHRYDAFGLRAFTSSTVNALAPDSLSAPNDMATFYSQDGKLLYQEEAPTSLGASSYRYFYLGDQVIARQTKSSAGGSPTTTYLHNDAIGSSLAETNSSGAVVATQHYQPFGYPQAPEPAGFGFAGQYSDGGLIYMRARYYSAFLGRFLSTDPMLPDDATGGNFNRYAYAYNNPYKFTDPDGLCPMGCPDDITDPVTIEESADILGAVAGAIESLDEALAPLGPEGGVEFHAAAAPIAGVLREAAAGVEAVGDVAKISGAAQVTREAGKETMHAATSARIAGEQAARLDAESVHLNQTIRTATGKAVPSSLRPDVQTVRTDGKVDVHEVLSPGQDAGASAAKYNNALGNRAGIIKCVPQDKC